MNELYHHGILGQKWGVRRFQNKDGSLKPAGKKRKNAVVRAVKKFGNSYTKSNTQKYKKAGLSDEEAKAAAERKTKMMKRIAIGAGVAIGTAAAVYAVRTYGRNYVDDVIKAGTTIQTVSEDRNRLQNGKAYYTAYRDADVSKYTGLWGVGKSGNKYALRANVAKEMRIASTPNAKKAFESLKRSDPEFKRLVGSMNYKSFNQHGLLMGDADSMKMQSKFYEKLKAAGYQGVHDLNDRRFSGYNTKASIIFDNDNFKKNASGVMDISIRQLTDSEINKARKFANRRVLLDSVTHPAMVATGAYYLGSETSTLYDSKVAKDAKRRKDVSVKAAVPRRKKR